MSNPGLVIYPEVSKSRFVKRTYVSISPITISVPRLILSIKSDTEKSDGPVNSAVYSNMITHVVIFNKRPEMAIYPAGSITS